MAVEGVRVAPQAATLGHGTGSLAGRLLGGAATDADLMLVIGSVQWLAM